MQNLTCAKATTFHLTALLLHPHVQRRQHQRQRPLFLISIPHWKINQNWLYGNVTLNIEKTKAYLSLGIDTVHENYGHKAAAKRENISNMFTYISEHRPSVKIWLCPIYNLRLKPYDSRDAEWIPESRHDNEFTMQMSQTRGLMDWWINQKQSCQIITWSSVCDY